MTKDEYLKDKRETKTIKKNESNDTVKYAVPAAIVAFGFFIGGNLTQGVYAGVLVTAGFWILCEKLRTFYPGAYNWLLDHSVEADFLMSAMAAIMLGFTVTGIIAAAVVNLLISLVLENYRDNVGKIKGTKSVTASVIIGTCVTKGKEFISTVKDGFKQSNEEVMQ
jgi:apolipoprotein N-acyltransferase